MRWLRRFRPSPAMVVASLALLVALGGTSYAAVQALPRNSVTTVQVKDFSLLNRDFKRGQVPRGPAGPPGPAGPAGPTGPAGPAGGGAAFKWALVRADANITRLPSVLQPRARSTPGWYVSRVGSPPAAETM